MEEQNKWRAATFVRINSWMTRVSQQGEGEGFREVVSKEDWQLEMD